MIEIQTERGLVRPEGWDDVISRPGFTSAINPDTVELKDVIGQYEFRDQIPCGFTTCRQPHNRGYIVETVDGRETNIGQYCGYTHLGLVFKQRRNVFERFVEDQKRRESLEEFKSHAPALRERLQVLRKKRPNAEVTYNRSQKLQNASGPLPERVVEEVRAMIRNRTTAITLERETTDEEREVMRTGGQSADHYRTEQVGILDCVDFLYPENDLRRLLYEDLEPTLTELADLKIDQLSRKELRDWTKRAEDIDRRLERFGTLLDRGRRLLAPPNLRQLDRLLSSRRERKQLQKFVNALADEGF